MKSYIKAMLSGETNRSTRLISIATICIAVIMGLTAMVTSYMVNERVHVTFDNLYETREIQFKVASISGMLLDAETGIRGFALTSDKNYLAPQVKAERQVGDVIAALQKLMESDNELMSDIESYLNSVEIARKASAQTLELLQSNPNDTEGITLRLNESKAALDQIRLKTETMQAAVRAQLQVRRDDINVSTSLLLLSGIVIVLGLGLIIFTQSRDIVLQSMRLVHSEKEASATIADLSKSMRHSSDELAGSYAKLSLALRSARVQIFGITKDGMVHWVSDPESPVLGQHEIPFSLPHLASPEDCDTLLNALTSSEVNDISIKINETDKRTSFYKLNIMRDTTMAEGLLLGCAVDVTELKAREENTFWLLRELSHRSKNLLAIVQSIARQTAITTSSTSAFQRRFADRLAGLAAAHDLLVKTSYSGADLRSLIITQFGARTGSLGSRLQLIGPEVVVRHEAAQNIAMAIQELKSNAEVHGALSNDRGEVHIEWRKEQRDGEPVLVLNWRESGGPPPKSDSSAGFGTSIITKNLPRSLDGHVTLVHTAEGTNCEVILPIRRLDPEMLLPQPQLN